jgi:hypothetical protein
MKYRGYTIEPHAKNDGSFVIWREGDPKPWSSQPSLDFAKKFIDDEIAQAFDPLYRQSRGRPS